MNFLILFKKEEMKKPAVSTDFTAHLCGSSCNSFFLYNSHSPRQETTLSKRQGKKGEITSQMKYNYMNCLR